MSLPLALHLPFLDESAVILVIGLLLFGKRLPEVGRSIGKGIVEFKKGLQGIEDDVATAGTAKPQYKFDPNTGQPIQQIANASTAAPAGAKFDPYTGQPLSSGSSS
jgi:sec-independent protein translocase protein TatA